MQRLKKNYFLLVSTFNFIFFFNLLSGQRGLISYFEKTIFKWFKTGGVINN